MSLFKKETEAEKEADKAAKDFANKSADNTPPYEQDGLYPDPGGLGPFGGKPAATSGAQKEKA